MALVPDSSAVALVTEISGTSGASSIALVTEIAQPQAAGSSVALITEISNAMSPGTSSIALVTEVAQALAGGSSICLIVEIGTPAASPDEDSDRNALQGDNVQGGMLRIPRWGAPWQGQYRGPGNAWDV